MTTKLHREATSSLGALGYQTSGFRASIIETLSRGVEDKEEAVCIRDEVRSWCNIYPDAFRWLVRDDREDGEPWRHVLEVVEIEDTHLVRKERMDKWALIWFYLDCECIDMRFFVQVVGRNIESVDIEKHYFEEVGA